MYKIKSVEYSYLINIELKVLNHQNTFSSSSDSIMAFPVRYLTHRSEAKTHRLWLKKLNSSNTIIAVITLT